LKWTSKLFKQFQPSLKTSRLISFLEGATLRQGNFFELIGEIIYAGLDCDGNIHLVLKNNSEFWREVAVKFLRSKENHIVKLRFMPWSRKRVGEALKSSHKPSTAVSKGEV